MVMGNPAPVVVAVGHEPIGAALEFGVAEAARAGCGVHLVHALARAHDGPEYALVTAPDHERMGRQVLGAAMEQALDLAGDAVPVTSALVQGTVVPAVVSAAADDARMIVLQHRRVTGLRRALTRSVASGVAARARNPVVSVPSDWSGEPTGGPHPTVTVGVEHPQRAHEVLRRAVEATASRGATLHALHAWHLGTAETALTVTPSDEAHWTEEMTKDIRAALDGLGDAAGVPTEIHVRHRRPADALIEASRGTDLLVLGRHDPVFPLGSHLGPVVRAVLQEADCPVMLVDPRAGAA
jgi:nucleotide-binding universal stress UspA family protein